MSQYILSKYNLDKPLGSYSLSDLFSVAEFLSTPPSLILRHISSLSVSLDDLYQLPELHSDFQKTLFCHIPVTDLDLLKFLWSTFSNFSSPLSFFPFLCNTILHSPPHLQLYFVAQVISSKNSSLYPSLVLSFPHISFTPFVSQQLLSSLPSSSRDFFTPYLSSDDSGLSFINFSNPRL